MKAEGGMMGHCLGDRDYINGALHGRLACYRLYRPERLTLQLQASARVGVWQASVASPIDGLLPKCCEKYCPPSRQRGFMWRHT
jgi:hypothetical protein